MSTKHALIIATTEYADLNLAKLTAPGKDAEDLARVLQDKAIAAFDEVKTLLNQPEPTVRVAIDEFFDHKKADDLLLLYFSGHGVRDEAGALYLALKNTSLGRLRSTGLKSDFIRQAMDESYSKRQILILDCCNSGAFAQGTKAAVGGSMGTQMAFKGNGYGRVILTASDATQFAWEGNQFIGETQNSLFTHFLIAGMAGEADRDGDGTITIDDLYDYAYEQIIDKNPKQTPGKWSFGQKGEMVLVQRENSVPKPPTLPDDLVAATQDERIWVREATIPQLEKYLTGRDAELARQARALLEKMAAEDDSRRVSQSAQQVLEKNRKPEVPVEISVPPEPIKPNTETTSIVPDASKPPIPASKTHSDKKISGSDDSQSTPKPTASAPKPQNAGKMGFLFSWWKRSLIGAAFSVIVSIPLLAAQPQFGLLSFVAGVGAFSGLVLHPRKSSFWLVVVSTVAWLIYGNSESPNGLNDILTIAVVVIIGFLTGASVSRVFYWVQLIWTRYKTRSRKSTARR